MGSTKLRSTFRRVVAGAVAVAGLTAGIAIGSGATASAAPDLPPLPVGSADVTGLLNQATSVVGNVSSALQGLASLDLGSLGGLGGTVRPASGPITTYFGNGHYGIDIAAPTGAPILAVANGTVINAGPAQGFGLWIRIRHDDGTVTTYGHNDVNFVSVGQRVNAGQRIANVGSRGNSTGPHLHFEVDLPGGVKTDPIPWLAAHGVFLL